MADQPKPLPMGATQWLVYLNLEKPWKRAMLAAVVAGVVTYAIKPSCFFDEEGCMRKQHVPYMHPERLPDDPEDESTNVHFLTVPMGCGLLAAVFT